MLAFRVILTLDLESDSRNLFLWSMVERFRLTIALTSTGIISQTGIETNTLDDNPTVGFRLNTLHSSTAVGPMRTDCLKIKRSRDDFDIVQRELTALGDNFAVECDESGTVVVQPVSVATLLIGVEIYTAELQSRAQSTLRSATVTKSPNTFSVASRMRSTRVCSFRNS